MNRLFVFICALVLCGCGNGKRYAVEIQDTVYVPRYAEGFEIYRQGSSSIINIKNPWQGAKEVNGLVFVSRNGENPPEGFDGVVIRSDIRKVACMSSSHVAFVDALGQIPSVCAVSGLRYITNDSIRSRAAAGAVKDVGYEGNINYEMLVLLRPDVVFMYSVAGERLPVLDKLKELRIPVVMIGEYLEPTPLGKAEWLVVFGEIFNSADKAKELLGQVFRDYELAKKFTRNVPHRPRVMLNAPWRDTWFVPGDRSYMVELLRDAGAEYVCSGVDSEQSRAINGETAYMYASKAEYWLNPNNADSLAQLVRDNPRFADIPAVINKKVYNNNKRSTPGGGSDFWESGVVYPNLVLMDMISIFHPNLLHEHELHYFKHLE